MILFFLPPPASSLPSRSGGVRLEPANQAMKPIEVKKGALRIQGKVVGVMRFYEGT